MPEDEPRTIARRGRPRAAPSVRMYVRVTTAEYDRLCHKALTLKIPLARLVRQELGRVR